MDVLTLGAESLTKARGYDLKPPVETPGWKSKTTPGSLIEAPRANKAPAGAATTAVEIQNA